MDDVPKLVNGKVSSVYETQCKDGKQCCISCYIPDFSCRPAPPTRLQAYQSLVEAERVSSLSRQMLDKTTLGNAQLINIAIELEDEQ